MVWKTSDGKVSLWGFDDAGNRSSVKEHACEPTDTPWRGATA